MSNYELLYTLPAKYTDVEIRAEQEKITNALTGFGMSISRNEEVGKIKIAYPMSHHRYGHFILVEFDAPAPALAKINEYLRLSKDTILRHQIFKREQGVRPFLKLADPEARIEYREPVAVTASVAAVPESIAVSKPLSQEELDKQLSAIEEDITKSL